MLNNFKEKLSSGLRDTNFHTFGFNCTKVDVLGKLTDVTSLYLLCVIMLKYFEKSFEWIRRNKSA